MKLRIEKDKGFTFIETLLTVVIIGIIASVTAKVLIVGLDIYTLVVNRNESFHSARVAMERMQDEIIKVKTADISFFTSGTFRFTDADGLSATFTRASTILDGAVVYGIVRNSNYLAGNATQLRFTYYRSNGGVAFTKGQIRRINIDFTITISAETGSIHLRSEVFPRNFMYTDFKGA